MSLRNKLFSLGLVTILGLKALMPIEAKADDLNRNNFNLESITEIKNSNKFVFLLEFFISVILSRLKLFLFKSSAFASIGIKAFNPNIVTNPKLNNLFLKLILNVLM